MRRLLTVLQIMALVVIMVLIIGPPIGTSPEIAYAQGTYADNPPAPGPINFATAIHSPPNFPASDTQTLTITDGGGSPPALIVSDVQLTLNQSNVFTLDPRDGLNNPVVFPTAFDVTNNGPLTINITCQSASANTFLGTLVVTHNDPGPATMETYNLSCTVTAPDYASTPPPANNVNIATDDETNALGTVTLTNSATVPLGITSVSMVAGSDAHLSITSGMGPFTVAAGGGTSDINVQCAPNDDDFVQPTINYLGTLRVEHNAPNIASPVDYPVNCTVTGTPDMSSNPAPGGVINVGSALVGVMVDNNTALELQNNVGVPAFVNGNLSITNMQFTGGDAGDFSFLTPTVFTVPENNTSNVGIRCIPSADVLRTTTLEVFHNDNVLASPTTYTVNCTGLTPAAEYTSMPTIGSTINFGTGLVNQPITLTMAVTITNPGSATLSIQNGTAITGGNAGDYTLNTGTPFFINPGNSASLSITCTPSAAGLRTAQLNVAHNGTNVGSPANYNLECTGSNTAPGYTSAPLPGNQLTMNTAVNVTSAPTNLSVSETGDQTLTINSATAVTNTGSATFSVTGAFPINIPDGGAAQNISVTCINTLAETSTGTLTVNHNAAGSPATYPLQCNTTGGGAGGAGYSSNPTPGSTITINTPLNTTGNSTIVISEIGTANLNITNIVEAGTSTQISVSGPALPITIVDNSGNTTTETIACLSATAGTFNETLTITHNAPGSPAVYNITCTVSSATATTVQSATDTAATSTASAVVPATSVTQCPANQVLSQPFPGNASGEYLLINCFVVSTQGQVSITLALALTNPSSFVTAERLTAIQASPANVLFYQMGSWFLTPSTYNAATQTYTFTAAAGANIYGMFFGTITEPVGAQGTSAFAGTTTGNVEDALDIDEPNRPPFAAIFSSAFVLFVAAIFFSRRFNKGHSMKNA